MTAEEFRKTQMDVLLASGVDRERAERVVDIAMHAADEGYGALTRTVGRLPHDGEYLAAIRLACEVVQHRITLTVETVENFVKDRIAA